MNLQFSRELLPLRTAEITEACARSVDPAAPAMQMLSGYLGRLFEVADDLTAPQRLDAGRAAIDLLAMVLRDVTPSVPGGDGPDDVLLEMMRMYVREHLADPHLRVEELARRHHVSVRHAYTLFARIGTTPGAYLREQRLLAAQVMLSDPRHARLGMSGIAAAVGFLELRTFERAFRRQYGMAPGCWRHEHRRSGSAPATLKQEMPHAQESPDPLTAWWGRLARPATPRPGPDRCPGLIDHRTAAGSLRSDVIATTATPCAAASVWTKQRPRRTLTVVDSFAGRGPGRPGATSRSLRPSGRSMHLASRS